MGGTGVAETILITGGSGFIGTELARSLMEEGHEIAIFDLKPPEALFREKKPAHFVRGDITDFAQVLNAIRDFRPDGVIHLAALLSEPSERNPWASISVNAIGTYHMFEAARLFDVKKVLFSSSMAVYVKTGVKPDVVGEETTQRPELIYGITKVFSEQLGLYYHRKFGIDTRGIRLPVLVGPRVESPGFGQFNSLLIKSGILGKPFEINVPEETVIPLLYIDDAVRALAMLYNAAEEGLKTRIYNVGQIEPPPSTAEIVDMVKRFCPNAAFTFKPDPLATEVSRNTPRRIRCDEAREEWGWHVSYSLEEMVKDFIRKSMRPEEE
jgi:threonine 3-dehydrogenase